MSGNYGEGRVQPKVAADLMKRFYAETSERIIVYVHAQGEHSS